MKHRAVTMPLTEDRRQTDEHNIVPPAVTNRLQFNMCSHRLTCKPKDYYGLQ